MSDENKVDFHAGDAFPVILDYEIDGIPAEDFGVDEIEVTYGKSRFLLSDGGVYLDSETGKYTVFLTQKATLGENGGGGIGEMTVRFKKDEQVVADYINEFRVGRSMSGEVI